MTPTRTRPGDQVLPAPGGADVFAALRADLEARNRLGRERYGQDLATFDGRDSLRDAFEEALDLVVYLKKLMLEREAHRVAGCWPRTEFRDWDRAR